MVTFMIASNDRVVNPKKSLNYLSNLAKGQKLTTMLQPMLRRQSFSDGPPIASLR